MKKLLIVIVFILSGCSTSHLVSSWKNPDIVFFDANQVLVIGMSQDMDVRTDFETKMRREFKRRDAIAFRSIDLFDIEFTTSKKTEQQLSEVEQQLLDKDFDAILLTKVLGSENKKTFAQKVDEIADVYSSFSEDYLDHQGIYYEDEYYEEYTVYHVETSLYCICVDKERELIWRGVIHVTDPKNISKAVNDYVELVIFALEDQDLIFRKPIEDEITGL